MPDPPKQQLHMLWPEHLISSPPQVSLPDGYSLRTFRAQDPEDEIGYLRVMHQVGFDSFDHGTVQRTLRQVLPEGFFLITHRPSEQIVATAMAVHNPAPLHPFGGELGWVAGSPDHAGRGLGRVVCAAVTARFLGAGYRRIYLRTDDWRLAAIKTYLRLGYVPFLYAPDMHCRWEAICTRLGWPFTPSDWPAHVAPAAGDEDEGRPNADRLDRYPRRQQWIPDRVHRGFALMGDVDAFGDESLYRPSQLGIATIMPGQVVSGQTAGLELTFTAGPAGLPEGAQLTFVMRGQQPLGRSEDDYVLQAPQGCRVQPAEKGFGFVLVQGHLLPGQRVVLLVEPFTWTPLAGRREFKVVIKRDDRTPEQRLPEPLIVEVLPGPLHRLEAVLPCSHRPGQPLPVHVTARDQYDNRVPWTGPLDIDMGGQRLETCMEAGLSASSVVASPAPLSRAVVHLLRSEPGTGAESCASNPSVRSEDLQLYVGDLHCHDFLSEAEGYPDQVYRWAIEDRALDFVSVVPQAHGWLDNETWTVTKYMNERYLCEGAFVTFLGFEWQHSGYGDKVIHYLGGDQPYLPVDDPRYNTPAKLYGALRAADALVIGHHPGYPVDRWVPGTDFGCVETDVERLVELWSMHGSSEGYDPDDRPLVERESAGGVMAALRSGLRLGFVAGSDTHSARPGGSAREPRPYWGGLAAVWASDLSRRALYRALQARRTYALTRARIVLRMTVNGALMGSEVPACDHADICIDAWAPGDIERVEVLKDTAVLHTFAPGHDECHLELEDLTGGPAFYHCRVTLASGDLAVCSPVWVG